MGCQDGTSSHNKQHYHNEIQIKKFLKHCAELKIYFGQEYNFNCAGVTQNFQNMLEDCQKIAPEISLIPQKGMIGKINLILQFTHYSNATNVNKTLVVRSRNNNTLNCLKAKTQIAFCS